MTCRVPCSGQTGGKKCESQEVHVKQRVVICAMQSAVPRETAAHTGHAGVKTLHSFIQAVLSAAADHDMGMSQLLVITLQTVADNHHSRRIDTHPPGGKGLKELG